MAQYKIQHYVPQAYLKNFGNEHSTGKNYSVWIYDKKLNDGIKRKGIDNICCKQYFYSHKDECGLMNTDTEKFFHKIETEIGATFKYLKDLLNTGHIEELFLSNKHMNAIINFIAVQIFRGPKTISPLRNEIFDAFKLLRMNCQIDNSDEVVNNEVSKHMNAVLFGERGDKRNDMIRSVLKNKKWIISIIDCDKCKRRYVTSDNPIMITNGYSKTNALVDSWTEISIPIFDRLAISLFNPKIENQIRYEIDDGQILNANISFAKNSNQIIISKTEKDLIDILESRTELNRENPKIKAS
jgi:hypothetical protein